ncbi:hypothetical protein LPJ53_004282 [Coemansia erecta]|uniref:Uncharacterized protein n=1 Tax=Coemansia erecta TaxID=147472 RepID=A0A9W7XZB9_9FUNG|nr:hypothetical protein LPJ53_004282 [Coemansia erecta]
MATYVYSNPYYSQHMHDPPQVLTLCAFYTNTDACHVQHIYASLTPDFQQEFEAIIRKFADHSPGVFKISYAPPARPVSYKTRLDGEPYAYENVRSGGTIVFNQVRRPTPLDHARWLMWKYPMWDKLKSALAKQKQK